MILGVVFTPLMKGVVAVEQKSLDKPSDSVALGRVVEGSNASVVVSAYRDTLPAVLRVSAEDLGLDEQNLQNYRKGLSKGLGDDDWKVSDAARKDFLRSLEYGLKVEEFIDKKQRLDTGGPTEIVGIGNLGDAVKRMESDFETWEELLPETPTEPE